MTLHSERGTSAAAAGPGLAHAGEVGAKTEGRPSLSRGASLPLRLNSLWTVMSLLTAGHFSPVGIESSE